MTCELKLALWEHGFCDHRLEQLRSMPLGHLSAQWQNAVNMRTTLITALPWPLLTQYHMTWVHLWGR